MNNKYLVILFIEFLLLLAIAGMFVAVDNRVAELNKEMEIKLYEQQQEIEQVQKKQRVLAQDIDFLEKLYEGKL